jgi:hypothetical protein
MDDQRLFWMAKARVDDLTREAERVRQIREARRAQPARQRTFRWRRFPWRIWRALVVAR